MRHGLKVHDSAARLALMLLWLLLMPALSFAQDDMVVAKFYEAHNDTDALLEGTQKFDQNGERSAIIKVETTQKGFTFDVGTLGVVDVVEKPGEVWVYVPHSVKRITIRHAQLGTLRDYYFPVAIEKGRCYVMKLVTGQVTTTVRQAVTSQYLVVHVEPADAILEIDGQPWTLRNGGGLKYMPFGTYDYIASCGGYHDARGKVTVNDANSKVELNIRLKPTFGWLKLDLAGMNAGDCILYVDKVKATIPASSDSLKLAVGGHRVYMTCHMYKPFERQVEIIEGGSLVLVPEFLPNFSNVTLTAGEGEEIWINGTKEGSGKWTGRLEAGDYRFEVKKASHRDAFLNASIEGNGFDKAIKLPSPTPIYGMMRIESEPFGATIQLDGKTVGKTPLQIPEILVGEHSLVLKCEGCKTLRKTVTVSEGRELIVRNTLLPGRNAISVSAAVPGATVYVDGVAKGPAGALIDVPEGEHKVKVKAEGYTTYSTIVTVADGETSTVQCEMTAAVTRINGYEFVDLGLSVKWATCNVGASKPEEYGTYFAWGDVKGQTWNGSKWSGWGFETYPNYELDSNGNLLPEYDAAHVKLGGSWRMPTRAECQELKDNCTSKWTSVNGVKGRLFTSKKNENSIFLPAAGYGNGSRLRYAGSYGYYWSSTFYYDNIAWFLYFFSSYVNTSGSYRYYGQSVRPVSD